MPHPLSLLRVCQVPGATTASGEAGNDGDQHMTDYAALARRIKRDSRSIRVRVLPDGVEVIPVFQHPVKVQTWEEYQAAGIIYPDSETALAIRRAGNMATAAQTRRRLDVGAERVQPALRTLGQLRAAILDGADMADLLLLVDEVQSDLFRVEAAVGVCTPASLFEGQ